MNSSNTALPTPAFRSACDRAYLALVRAAAKLHRKGKYEAFLRFAQSTVEFAEKCHPGRFADGALENLVLAVGRDLEKHAGTTTAPLALGSPPQGKRRVLHVATTVYRIGGHTRLLARWMSADSGSSHSLVLVNQFRDEAVPDFLLRAVEQSGGSLAVLPKDAPLLEKARRLREAAVPFDFVFVHAHPADVVPVAAFAVPSGPPVAYMDHADHIFWAGPTVADLFIEYKLCAPEFCKRRRFARNALLLPLRVDDDAAAADRTAARDTLGIPPDAVVLLSIGSGYKFTPNDTHNFFRTGRKILDANPNAHLYVIGVARDANVPYLRDAEHERFHLLGLVPDPSAYQAAADIFLDPFPLGSGFGLLEACARGVSLVPGYDPEPLYARVDDFPGTRGLLTHPAGEAEYLARVAELVADGNKRRVLAASLRAQVLEFHSGKGWNIYLEKIYDFLRGAEHKPAAIPTAETRADAEDLVISRSHEVCYSRAPRLLNYGFQYWRELELSDLFALFLSARRLGEMREQPLFNLRCWLQLLDRKLIRRK